LWLVNRSPRLQFSLVSLPCLHSVSIISASWLISPSARNGLSQPSNLGLKIC
jgi:hypothetical protein